MVSLFSNIKYQVVNITVPAELNDNIQKGINWSAYIGGVLAFGLVVLGGVRMLSSAGEPAKVKEGQEMIVNALIGYAVVLLALVIIKYLFPINYV